MKVSYYFRYIYKMSENVKREEPRKRKREKDPNQIRMNTANSQLKWWLVKVPKYLGQKWIESQQSEVGTLQVSPV